MLTRQAQQRTSIENIEDVLAAIRARYGPLYTHAQPAQALDGKAPP
jgi:hypothetical protein